MDCDSILYRGTLGRPNTAWLHRPAQRGMGAAVVFSQVKVVMVQDGFVAEPPDGLHD